ncbi:hypothetical protein SAMN02745157_0039 [Kaistia soli DSM 19436]|uniref:Yip1 domain-containing protein n=1 Tax=Kaistia soli DSM 19436 TaxID=1122133 RepID=A0A1M5NXS0_9HYPH|nr:hypothetical protein [Kaistia soli]SHG94320.1 hypothetical protein SAMN02745157_0039 [Kaistia soli DSM 19436]
MFDPASIAAIRSAFDLFLGRRDALARFDVSIDGFWHSFRAIFYVLPFFAINAAVEHRMMLSDAVVENVSDGAFVAARLVDYGIDWIAMPALLALFAQRLGISRTFAPYIVVRNWALVVMSAPQALVSLLLGFGMLSFEISAAVSMIILGVMLRFHYLIIRWTLAKSVAFSIGLVAADIALSLVLSEVIDRLFGL